MLYAFNQGNVWTVPGSAMEVSKSGTPLVSSFNSKWAALKVTLGSQTSMKEWDSALQTEMVKSGLVKIQYNNRTPRARLNQLLSDMCSTSEAWEAG